MSEQGRRQIVKVFISLLSDYFHFHKVTNLITTKWPEPIHEEIPDQPPSSVCCLQPNWDDDTCVDGQ